MYIDSRLLYKNKLFSRERLPNEELAQQTIYYNLAFFPVAVGLCWIQGKEKNLFFFIFYYSIFLFAREKKKNMHFVSGRMPEGGRDSSVSKDIAKRSFGKRADALRTT